MEEENRILIYDLICEKLEDLAIRDFTLNVLSDHVHLVFMVEENDKRFPSSDSQYTIEVKIAVKLRRNRRTDFTYLTFAVINTIVTIMY